MDLNKFLLNLIEESRTKADSFRTTGEAIKKERATSGVGITDKKAKDAARKRAERAKQTPRSQKTKDELVKEVVAVKTGSGNVQLIFKDSFDKSKHQKINKSDTLSVEEAKSYTRDPGFEQTGASKLLFGDVKTKEKTGRDVTKKQKEDVAGKEARERGEEEEKEIEEPRKQAKRMDKKDIFGLMAQMTPEQLAAVPLEVRQEYFKQTRNPPTNTQFDSFTFEKLSTIFGINTLTSLPYNQQVINALMFLAKMKAGASEQELQSYAAISPGAFEFTKMAFSQARKILSQMGEQCIQNLVSGVESGNQSISSEGSVDMECGDYKFKISAGGEFLLTTDRFDQKSKTFRGLIAAALSQAISDPVVLKDQKMQSFAKNTEEVGNNFSEILITKENFAVIKKNPELLAKLQATPMTTKSGDNLGYVVDENGRLNKSASFENYKQAVGKKAIPLFKNSAKNESQFVDSFVQNILKMYYRGDMLKTPEMAPTHLVTQNGIFTMSDDYFNEISKNAVVSLKSIKDEIGGDNIIKSKKASEVLNKYVTVVEAKEKKEFKIEDLFIYQDSINPAELALNHATQNMDFDINVSLLPGFTPKDLNTIQYNYVKIGKKTVKIPVEKTELLALDVQENIEFIINDLLVEALTNNFVLSKLVYSNLLTDEEAYSLRNPSILNESTDRLKLLYRDLLERAYGNPRALLYILNSYNSNLYEKYVRNYKMEYRNYHGKPKQRKERAKRTAAREALIRKGKVKKGSEMDVDHKKPLRSGGSNGINNLRLRHKSKNRSDNGHKKGEKQNKDWE